MNRPFKFALIARLLLVAMIGMRAAPALAQSTVLPTFTNVIPPVVVLPGAPVTLTVMVSSVYENVGLVPSGTVDFFAGPDKYIGSATLSPSISTQKKVG